MEKNQENTSKKKAKKVLVYDFLKMFPNENSVIKFFESNIWGEVPKCPYCNKTNTIPAPKRNGHSCRDCRRYFTVRNNTIFENSRLSLYKWLYAIYLIQTSRKGISSLQLSKELGITQKSSWYMLHRIKESCIVDNGLFSGIVELDETYIGGNEKNKHSHKRANGTQGRSKKKAVIGLRARDGKVKAKSLNDVYSFEIQKYLNNNVEKSCIITTDEAMVYKTIRRYKKILANNSVSESVNGMASTHGVVSMWAVLKRGYYGTFHHFSKKHINRYVNGFTFRLNEGNC